MAFQNFHRPTSPQRGFALVLAVVLLLILTVFSLFAVNVGVFEQRTSANEYRAKMAAQVADAALNHAAESVRVLDKSDKFNPPSYDWGDLAAGEFMIPPGQPIDVTRWSPCTGADANLFPCGAVPALMRPQSYFYKGGVDLNGDGTVSLYEQRSISLPPVVDPTTGKVQKTRQLIQTVPSADPANPFQVEYEVGLVVCRLDTNVTATSTSPCTTDPARTSLNRAFTLVARSQVVGESSGATFVRTVVPVQDVQLNPKVPSLVAAGMINANGSMNIVGNPNSGGKGLPVSIWTRTDFKGSGSIQTCPYREWLVNNLGKTKQFAGAGSTSADGAIEVCTANTCPCPTTTACLAEQVGSPIKTCSGQQPSIGFFEGGDILDVDGSKVGAQNGELLDSPSFPRDLMEFLYGTGAQARNLDADGNGWNESNTADNVHTAATAGGDTYLIGQSVSATDFLSGFQRLTCKQAQGADPSKEGLGENSSGKFWIETRDGTLGGPPCTLDSVSASGDIGSPTKPVQLVLDGGIDLQTGTRVFGIAFGRDPRAITADGGKAVYATGGGGAQIYGAVVVEGTVSSNATTLIVFDSRLLERQDPDFNPNVASVPGGWSDNRVSY